MGACMCKFMWRQGVDFRCLLPSLSASSFAVGSLTETELTDFIRLAVQCTPETCVPLSHDAYVGAGNLNSGPDGCTDPSSQPRCVSVVSICVNI